MHAGGEGMKRFSKAARGVAFFLVLLSLAGCVTRHNNDLMWEVEDYLSYSLGEFTYEKEKYVRANSPIPHADHGYQWTVEYADDAGRAQTFVFNNTTEFDGQLLDYARELMQAQATEDLLPRHFSEEEIKDMRLRIAVRDAYDDDREVYLATLSALPSGLCLKSLTPAELHHDWQMQFSFSADTEAEGKALEGIKRKIEDCLRDAMAYLDDPGLTFTLTGKDTDHSYVLRNDGGSFVWEVYGDLADAANMVDGRLMVVRKLYVEDTLIMDVDMFWDKGTGEYHVDPYYVTKVLDALGIAYETQDHGKSYTWQIDGDDFEMNRSEGSILRNGKSIITYKFNPSTDINLSVFAEMTGTQVVYDEAARAIRLTKK